MPDFAQRFARHGLRAAALCIVAVGLSGCFDLAQRVSIGRDGSGRYETSLTADGIVGEALRNKSTDLTGFNRGVTTMSNVNGRVTQRSVVDFKSLGNLVFSDQFMSLTVRGHSLLGLGPSEMTFRRSFAVDRARAQHENEDRDTGGMGRAVAQSILGDHTYVFSVTLPGSIERIAPIVIGGQTIQPEVTGDFYNGHTITWRMPLYLMAMAHALTFEVDFSAYGWFSNVATRTRT
ncbi:MAG: hypothetical protein ABSD74_10245 [Rhizomicrobium sp.]|jgi:hypothetical protein